MSEQENSLRCDYVPGCGYKIWQDAKEFCYTTDAVFLGNFPHVVRKAKVLELGCGTGAISMLLESRGAAEVMALDCNPQVTKLVRQSVADNSLQDKFNVIDGDLRNYKQLLQPESMDLVAANPPYRNSGNVLPATRLPRHWRIFSGRRPLLCAIADALLWCSCRSALPKACSWR